MVVEASPLSFDMAFPRWTGTQVSGASPGALHSGVPPPEGGRKGGSIWMRKGWDPLINGRVEGPRRLPTEEGSH